MSDSFASCDSDLSLVKVGLKEVSKNLVLLPGSESESEVLVQVTCHSCCYCQWYRDSQQLRVLVNISNWGLELECLPQDEALGGSEALSQSEEKDSERLQILFQSWSLRALLYTLVGCTKNSGGLALYFHCLN